MSGDVRFVVGTHVVRNGRLVVEVFDGDQLLAVIYPGERAIRVVSKYLSPRARLVLDPGGAPAALTLRFPNA